MNNFYEANVENIEMIQQKFDILGNSLLISTVKRTFIFFFHSSKTHQNECLRDKRSQGLTEQLMRPSAYLTRQSSHFSIGAAC